MEYILILSFILLVTFLLEKQYKVHLYHSRKERFVIVGLFFMIGVVWDTFAIWRGDWVFPEGRNVGIRIGFMPLEEYLFILIIPYSILTVYKLLDAKLAKQEVKRKRRR